MTMAFQKFNAFVEARAHGLHDFSTAVLKLFLTDELPLATDTVKSDMAEIASTSNGYPSGGNTLTTVSSGQTSGVYKLVVADTTFTQSGANPIGPFRYLVVYNSSSSNRLVCWFDNGAEVTLAALIGGQFVVDFDGTNGLLRDAACP